MSKPNLPTAKPAKEPDQIKQPKASESTETRLDEALEETFPASDPVSIDTTNPHHTPEANKKHH